MKRPREDARLFRVAKEIAKSLQPRCAGTALRAKVPDSYSDTDTNGWSAEVGSLRMGKERYHVEIWLDRFSGHDDRKFYACFYHREAATMRRLAYTPGSPLPIRELTDSDMTGSSVYQMKRRLLLKEFGEPLLECYESYQRNFFGFYYPTRGTPPLVEARFCDQAVSFFDDVARSLPEAVAAGAETEDFPGLTCAEDRKLVKAHLLRERSRYLATKCKERDEYRCGVCGVTFAESYGKLGERFAEAHHKQALKTLTGKVKTRLDDLMTVCANCHRMLHQMEGKAGDVEELRKIVLKRQRAGMWDMSKNGQPARPQR